MRDSLHEGGLAKERLFRGERTAYSNRKNGFFEEKERLILQEGLGGVLPKARILGGKRGYILKLCENFFVSFKNVVPLHGKMG